MRMEGNTETCSEKMVWHCLTVRVVQPSRSRRVGLFSWLMRNYTYFL